jgi:murein DD-endopeptidase MepM/ murein hydrolase activator NlpD
MSTVSVDEGERVSGGDRVGAIGMTGRTFGPHVHVELYPAGVKPGDPYEAINPSPWLRDHGLKL